MTGIDEDAKKWLQSFLKDSVRFNEPMSRHTSFRVGGPADAFVVSRNLNELVGLIQGLGQRGLKFLIIGHGTNLLVKDFGFRGVIIVLKGELNHIIEYSNDGIVRAMAGTPLSRLCRFAIKNGLSGMNFALGIPGTAGGGIVTNAGTFLGDMGNILRKVTVIFPDGQIRNILKEKLRFSYRQLAWVDNPVGIKASDPVIVSGSFTLVPDDPSKIRKEARKIILGRKQRQPTWYPSAGCFFKNPVSGKTAGELIDIAGLKGKTFGGAQISTKHGNFIINRENASAADILDLMKMIQEVIWKKFGILLEPEVRIIGD